MADGYAQGTGRPALVNLHTSAGMGNAMGAIITASCNKTPLIITAGQQTRRMLVMEGWLTNVDATQLPRPWVKWSYETSRAGETPAALMRAYATAIQPPEGPVFLSSPLDDWNEAADEVPVLRDVSRRVAADPDRLGEFAEILNNSKNPALVIGAAVDRSQSQEIAIELAEKLKATVFLAPLTERIGFPTTHPQFQGGLPFAIKPLGERLKGYDTVLVVGAPVFRYYPYVEGDYLPAGTRLLHITDDPHESARAPVGDSIISDVGLACSEILELLKEPDSALSVKPLPRAPEPDISNPMSPDFVFFALSQAISKDTVITLESPSNGAAFFRRIPFEKRNQFFATASGGLGFGLPSAVGLALAERHTKRDRSVVSVLGDGSAQYSIQALWTAAQFDLPIVFLVLRNSQYAILKAFSKVEGAKNLPGMELPGISTTKLAEGYGVQSALVSEPESLVSTLREAVASRKPRLIEVQIDRDVPPLL